MKDITRRRLLTGVSVAGTSAFTGCFGRGQEEKEPSETPVISMDDLSFTAEVVEQQSENSPTTIIAELTNNSENEARISAQDTIVPRFEDGPDYHVILFPETDVGPNNPPDDSNEGCWRYTDDDFLARDVQKWHTIRPGDALQETYRIFTRGEDGPCLPDGEYQFTDVIQNERENEMQLIIEVSITEGMTAVEGEQRHL